MIKHLIFQIYAPLTSWGEPAVGNIRHSNIIPSRSALLGFLAAALGIRRNDECIDAFNQHYFIASRPFIIKGSWLYDFHTVQFPIPKSKNSKKVDEQDSNNLVTHREYYNDVYYQIIITETKGAPYSVEQIKQALLTPVFPLYVGRKNSPLSLPLAPIIYEGLLSDAFVFANEHYHQYHQLDPVLKYLVDSDANEYYWDHADQETHFDVMKIQLRQDQPINRKRWQFINRQQYTGHLKRSE